MQGLFDEELSLSLPPSIWMDALSLQFASLFDKLPGDSEMTFAVFD